MLTVIFQCYAHDERVASSLDGTKKSYFNVLNDFQENSWPATMTPNVATLAAMRMAHAASRKDQGWT